MAVRVFYYNEALNWTQYRNHAAEARRTGMRVVWDDRLSCMTLAPPLIVPVDADAAHHGGGPVMGPDSGSDDDVDDIGQAPEAVPVVPVNEGEA